MDPLRGHPGSIGVTAVPNTGSKHPTRKGGKGSGSGRYKKGASVHGKKYSGRLRGR